MSIRRGIQFAHDGGVRNLIVEYNAQTVISVLSTVKLDLSYGGWVIQDILELTKGFDRVIFSWIRRDGNLVALILVFYAFTISSPFFLVQISDNIVATLEAELAN